MPRDTRRFTPSWDLYSIALIGCIFFLGLLQWRLMPRFIDIYYHLSVMRMFKLAGGYPLVDFLQCAPASRPHLYPPLLHLLMLAFSSAGCTTLFIARFFEYIAFPGLLTVMWLVTRSVLHARVAFFAVMLCTAASALYYTAGILLPFTFAFIFLLLAFLSIEKKRPLAGGIALALACYTHTLMSLVALLAIALYGLFVRPRRRSCIGALIIALACAAPLFSLQFAGRSYSSLPPFGRGSSFEFSLIVYGLAAGGLVLALKRRGPYLFFGTLVLAMSLFAAIDPSRFFSSHGMAGFIFLAAVAADALYERLMRRFPGTKTAVIFLGAVAACCIVNPTMYRPGGDRPGRLLLLHSNLGRLLPLPVQNVYRGQISLYHSRYMDPLVALIRQHTRENGIIWSNLPYVGGMLSVMSERAFSGSMLPEVRCYADHDPVAAASTIVWFREADGSVSPELQYHVKRLGLKEVAATEVAFVYSNPGCRSTVMRSVPICLSLRYWFCMLIAAVAAALADALRYSAHSAE